MKRVVGTELEATLGGQAIERHTMHGDVYERLKHAIMSGQVKPGQMLSHRTLAAVLGTSVMPVRDAVRRLVAERALESYPNRTIGLPLHSRKKFDDICKIRVQLEGLAASEAASKINATTIKKLKKLQREMESANEYAAYMKANQSFHFLIYEAADMPLLRAIIEMLWLQIGPLFNYIGASAGPSAVPDRHGEIVKALEARDPKAAARALEADINEAYEYLLPYFEKAHGEAQLPATI